MKPYTVSIDIEAPRARVLELFDNPDNLSAWQTGFQSFEHLSGEPGHVGARAKVVYVNGKHRIELIETITKRDLPDAFDGTYEWKGGSNTLENRFIEVGPSQTRWESRCDYTFHSFFLKAMGFFAPGMFRKQNMKFLKNFKAFVEEGKRVDGA